MTINILMSGPIRPSETAVVEVIQTIRSQIPACRIFLSSWSESEIVRAAVDFYDVSPEPTSVDILSKVHSRTIQQTSLGLPDDSPGCRLGMYKMFYGVQRVCHLATPYVQDSDKVIRIRTDSVFLFDPIYLQSLLSSTKTEYITNSGDGFDWFAITTFGYMKRVWCFETLDEYNMATARSWNPETMVRNRITIPIHYLEKDKVRRYIIREGGFKHYYDPDPLPRKRQALPLYNSRGRI